MHSYIVYLESSLILLFPPDTIPQNMSDAFVSSGESELCTQARGVLNSRMNKRSSTKAPSPIGMDDRFMELGMPLWYTKCTFTHVIILHCLHDYCMHNIIILYTLYITLCMYIYIYIYILIYIIYIYTNTLYIL